MCMDYDDFFRRFKEAIRRGDIPPIDLLDRMRNWLNNVEIKIGDLVTDRRTATEQARVIGKTDGYLWVQHRDHVPISVVTADWRKI